MDFEQIPTDVSHYELLDYLDPRSLLQFRSVNKEFARLPVNDTYWRRILRRDFPFLAPQKYNDMEGRALIDIYRATFRRMSSEEHFTYRLQSQSLVEISDAINRLDSNELHLLYDIYEPYGFAWSIAHMENSARKEAIFSYTMQKLRMAPYYYDSIGNSLGHYLVLFQRGDELQKWLCSYIDHDLKHYDKNKYGTQLIHVAHTHRNKEIIDLITAWYANAEITIMPDKFGRSTFHVDCLYGHDNDVLKMIEGTPDQTFATTLFDSQFKNITYLVFNNNAELLDRFFARIVALQQNELLSRALLAPGKNRGFVANFGYAFSLAVFNNNEAMILAFIRAAMHYTNVRRIIYKWLTTKSLNIAPYEEITPLHAAAVLGYQDLIAIMLGYAHRIGGQALVRPLLLDRTTMRATIGHTQYVEFATTFYSSIYDNKPQCTKIILLVAHLQDDNNTLLRNLLLAPSLRHGADNALEAALLIEHYEVARTLLDTLTLINDKATLWEILYDTTDMISYSQSLVLIDKLLQLLLQHTDDRLLLSLTTQLWRAMPIPSLRISSYQDMVHFISIIENYFNFQLMTRGSYRKLNAEYQHWHAFKLRAQEHEYLFNLKQEQRSLTPYRSFFRNNTYTRLMNQLLLQMNDNYFAGPMVIRYFKREEDRAETNLQESHNQRVLEGRRRQSL